MNYNLITYRIYFLVISFTIIKVGRICYQNGNTYITHLMPNDIDFCHRINNLLLIGYYLLNIGYSVFVISNWEEILNVNQLIQSVAKHTSGIIFLLALLHYFNLYWITKFIERIK